MTERIRLISYSERVRKIKRAKYNLFALNSEDVYIDFLTDSGTGAMSDAQWSALMRGDESYAGSKSFRNLKKAITDILGYKHILPVHQGRAAENVFNELMVKQDLIVPGNAHFDTTKAHIEYRGGAPLDCTIKQAYQPDSRHPFKGNIDLQRLENILRKHTDKVAYILITITCNQVGGQPVSLENLKKTYALAKKYNKNVFLDGARFAENARFIQMREKGQKTKTVRGIAKATANCSDGMLMSAKKDAIVNMGGFIALNNKCLFDKLLPIAVLMEGLFSYGGMSGQNMEALAEGLYECIDDNYIRYRVEQVKIFGDKLMKAKIPILTPVGGHAVYIDAGKMLRHIPWHQFPGHALAVETYIKGGIRSVEIGSLLEGRDPATKENRRAKMELLRLAIPHRSYSMEHLDYVVEIFSKIYADRKSIRGMAFTYEAPILRHFSSKFKLV